MISVFYSDRQSCPPHIRLPSPSASKPAQVLADWLAHDRSIEIEPFQPVTAREFELAHDPTYVADVLACREANGFGTRDPEVAATLPWTVGSMVAAAKSALRTRKPSVSLTSGFHHACYDSGGSFCTFNGLIVAARALYAKPGKVGILDLDFHAGNGTVDIIERLDLHIPHLSLGYLLRSDWWELSRKELVGSWLLRDFRKHLCAAFVDCDLVLYQAGADSHIDDPLGGVFSTENYRLRDRIVFETLAELGVPVVWNLAGGYQRPLSKVLDLHRITLDECLRVHSA